MGVIIGQVTFLNTTPPGELWELNWPGENSSLDCWSVVLRCCCRWARRIDCDVKRSTSQWILSIDICHMSVTSLSDSCSWLASRRCLSPPKWRSEHWLDMAHCCICTGVKLLRIHLGLTPAICPFGIRHLMSGGIWCTISGFWQFSLGPSSFYFVSGRDAK